MHFVTHKKNYMLFQVTMQDFFRNFLCIFCSYNQYFGFELDQFVRKKMKQLFSIFFFIFKDFTFSKTIKPLLTKISENSLKFLVTFPLIQKPRR